MKKPIKIVTAVLCILAMAVFAACTTSPDTTEATATPSANVPAYDRDGFPFTMPTSTNTIVSIGPSNTEILVGLGFADAIIQTDMFSAGIPGIASDIATLDMMALDMERIISLNPCVVFVAGLARVYGEMEPLAVVSDVGISVVYIPTSTSIAEIKEDILFISAVMGRHSQGEAIVADMTEEINFFRQLGESVTQRRTVYFEISPAPFMFSFGTGTFLHEMIELVGATNIFGDQYSWLGVADEVLLDLNPDIIFTTTDFIDDPVGEIKSRSGWDSITAVQNGDVFQVNADASQRPSQNIVIALREIAAAVHPDEF